MVNSVVYIVMHLIVCFCFSWFAYLYVCYPVPVWLLAVSISFNVFWVGWLLVLGYVGFSFGVFMVLWCLLRVFCLLVV